MTTNPIHLGQFKAIYCGLAKDHLNEPVRPPYIKMFQFIRMSKEDIIIIRSLL